MRPWPWISGGKFATWWRPGQSEDHIKVFLTDRYGEFVLYRPRWSGATAVLWLAPIILVLMGATWLWRIVQRRSAMPVTTEEQDAQDA